MDDGLEYAYYFSESWFSFRYRSPSSDADFGFFAHVSATEPPTPPNLPSCKNVNADYGIQTFSNIDFVNGYNPRDGICELINFDTSQELELYNDFYAIEKCCDVLQMSVNIHGSVSYDMFAENKRYSIRNSNSLFIYWYSDTNLQEAGFSVNYKLHGLFI